MTPLHTPRGRKAVRDASVHFELLEGEGAGAPHLPNVVIGECASSLVHATQH